ncbi:hypothetical protein CU097_002017, partial [Rhizopus azygosporus]
TYVRTRHGMIKAPKTPNKLKLVFTEISKVLSGMTLLLAMLSACTTTIQASPHQIILSIPPPSIAL